MLLSKADWDANVLRALAGNPSLHGSVQKRLPLEDVAVAKALAENPNLTSRSQCRLYLHKSWEVLAVLAGNPSLSARLQKGLAEKAGVGSRSTVRRTGDLSIRSALAGNPSLDPALVEALLGEGDNNVDRVLAKNPAVSVAGQHALYQRTSSGPRAVLLESCPRLDPALQWRALDGTTHEHVNLARNPSLDPEVARELSRSDESYVLTNLAQNPNLPRAAQHQLSVNPDPEVRAQLLLNPSLEVDDSYDCSFLAAGDRTSAYLLDRTRQYDPAARAVLVPDFAGTVTELRAVLEAFEA